eukprot:9290190-Pyramimonas_sp.AAC.1
MICQSASAASLGSPVSRDSPDSFWSDGGTIIGVVAVGVAESSQARTSSSAPGGGGPSEDAAGHDARVCGE